MKSRILANQHSNGLPEKVAWLMRTWEVLDATSWIQCYMLMLFIEEVDKWFQLLEELIMLLNWLLNQDYKSQSSCAKSQLLWKLLVVCINAYHKEEVLWMRKNKLPVLHWIKLRHFYQLLNHSDSLPIWDHWQLDKPSHNVCSIIGHWLVVIHMKVIQSALKSLTISEREKVSKKDSHLWITIWTSCESTRWMKKKNNVFY